MKSPAIECSELSDEEIEALAAEAMLYRTAAGHQFVVAGLLLAAGHRGGFRWHMNEGARFCREAGRRDGRGVNTQEHN